MRNITITLDVKTARLARVRAAERNMSVSRYVGELLRKDLRQTREYQEAMQRYFSSNLAIRMQPGERHPAREGLHDRAALRRK